MKEHYRSNNKVCLSVHKTDGKPGNRKTRLTLITNATVKYRRKDRAVVVEVHPDTATIRLLGTRAVRYEVSWRGIHDYAARVAADKKLSERRGRKKNAVQA